MNDFVVSISKSLAFSAGLAVLVNDAVYATLLHAFIVVNML